MEFFRAAFLHTFPRDCFRSSPPEVISGKYIMKICSKFAGENPCRSAISIKFLCNFFEIALRHGCSPVNLLNVFGTSFYKKNCGRLLDYVAIFSGLQNIYFLELLIIAFSNSVTMKKAITCSIVIRNGKKRLFSKLQHKRSICNTFFDL